MSARAWVNQHLARHADILRVAMGIIVQTGILALGGLAFWAVVGHNAGGNVLGKAATASSIASLCSGLAAAGAMHLVIARREQLRPLVSSLALVCPVVAFAFASLVPTPDRLIVGLWAAASALGLVTDAAAVAAKRPRRVVVRGGVQVIGTLAAALFIHSFVGFIVAQTFFTGVSALIQFAAWAAAPQFVLLRRLSKDVWSNHIAGVTGFAPAFVVAPLATVMSSSVIAGRAYLAMAIVGPLTSVSVALQAGLHTERSREDSETRHLYARSLLTVFLLATLASCATFLLRFAGPSFAAIAHVVAVMTFATVLDASANIFCGVWRVQRRLIAVPMLYIVELIAFVGTVALTIKHIGLSSIVCGWYAQGVAGVLTVLVVEHRVVPRRTPVDAATAEPLHHRSRP